MVDCGVIECVAPFLAPETFDSETCLNILNTFEGLACLGTFFKILLANREE